MTVEKSATAYKKVNTAGTDENLFRLVSVLGHGARVLSLEPVSVTVPVLGSQAASMNGALCISVTDLNVKCSFLRLKFPARSHACFMVICDVTVLLQSPQKDDFPVEP